MTNYNGWTNYATWRVNLELFDGQPCEWVRSSMSQYDVAEQLKEIVNEYLEMDGKGLVLDYARAFVSDVNWYDIAKHYVEEEPQEEMEA